MLLAKLILVIALSAFGLAGLYQSIKGFTMLRAAQAWPSVNGTITAFTETEKTAIHKSPTTRSLALTYHYSVNGTEYIGHTDYFGVKISSHNSHMTAYKKGETIPVYYNPKNPTQSVLKPASYRGIIFPLLASLIFLTLPFYLLFIERR